MLALTNKPVVRYIPYGFYTNPVVGERAKVIPLDHPDTFHVDNGYWATTSTVLQVFPDGSFETRNTLYVLDEDYPPE